MTSLLKLLGRILWSQRGVFVWMALLLVIACAWVLFNRDTLATYLDSRRQRNELRDELTAMDSQVKELERERDVLARGGFESEKTAREVYRMSKPGEKVLYLKSPEEPTSPTLRLRHLRFE
ncbi:hypothetical protein HQ520_05070 [bacterium]|nr:hypothetical protein [bacterium]